MLAIIQPILFPPIPSLPQHLQVVIWSYCVGNLHTRGNPIQCSGFSGPSTTATAWPSFATTSTFLSAHVSIYAYITSATHNPWSTFTTCSYTYVIESNMHIQECNTLSTAALAFRLCGRVCAHLCNTHVRLYMQT